MQPAAALWRRRQVWIERRLLSTGQTDRRTDTAPLHRPGTARSGQRQQTAIDPDPVSIHTRVSVVDVLRPSMSYSSPLTVQSLIIIIPAKARDYVLPALVCLSVCLSVCYHDN